MQVSVLAVVTRSRDDPARLPHIESKEFCGEIYGTWKMRVEFADEYSIGELEL